ncbi:Jag family protein [Desulfolithobacter sp.]
MAKAKVQDFYGSDVPEAIDKACQELGVSQEELDIEILETGSAGIFGLCRKKAHIRAGRRQADVPGEKKKPGKRVRKPAPVEGKGKVREIAVEEGPVHPPAAPAVEDRPSPDSSSSREGTDVQECVPAPTADSAVTGKAASVQEPPEPPGEEMLAAVKADIEQILVLMGYPSEVRVSFSENTVLCHISGEHEEAIVGQDGRTLDSLQYLLRKMMSQRLPDRIMLTIDVGNFRERRMQELKERALELAEQVKEHGKTQAIPALNPPERRVVHMVLQEDKEIRSRSVGEGLFKKVLIYKPGKGRKSRSQSRRRGRSGGRTSSK